MFGEPQGVLQLGGRARRDHGIASRRYPAAGARKGPGAGTRSLRLLTKGELDHMTNSLKPPYTFDKLRAATEPQLVNEINLQLQEFETSTKSGSDKAVNALNAQFLMQERARRVQERREELQDRQARIMILCTIAITFMTLAITFMTYCIWRSPGH
jgi:hypothetical protein